MLLSLSDLRATAPDPFATPLALIPAGRGLSPWWLPGGASASVDCAELSALEPALYAAAGPTLWFGDVAPWSASPRHASARNAATPPPGLGHVTVTLLRELRLPEWPHLPDHRAPLSVAHDLMGDTQGGRILIDRRSVAPEVLIELRAAAQARGWSVIDLAAPVNHWAAGAAGRETHGRADYQLETPLISIDWPGNLQPTLITSAQLEQPLPAQLSTHQSLTAVPGRSWSAAPWFAAPWSAVRWSGVASPDPWAAALADTHWRRVTLPAPQDLRRWARQLSGPQRRAALTLTRQLRPADLTAYGPELRRQGQRELRRAAALLRTLPGQRNPDLPGLPDSWPTWRAQQPAAATLCVTRTLQLTEAFLNLEVLPEGVRARAAQALAAAQWRGAFTPLNSEPLSPTWADEQREAEHHALDSTRMVMLKASQARTSEDYQTLHLAYQNLLWTAQQQVLNLADHYPEHLTVSERIRELREQLSRRGRQEGLPDHFWELHHEVQRLLSQCPVALQDTRESQRALRELRAVTVQALWAAAGRDTRLIPAAQQAAALHGELTDAEGSLEFEPLSAEFARLAGALQGRASL